jgi:hypothetical protein
VWARIAARLRHHLDWMLVTARAGASGCARLPLETLSDYLKVLCTAASGSPPVLHDLLAAWHDDLAATTQRDAATYDVRAAAFLLLLQHLAPRYAVERAAFRRRLLVTLQASGGSSAACNNSGVDGGGGGAGASLEGGHRCTAAPLAEGPAQASEQEQALLDKESMRFMEELMRETAPGCYAPLLAALLLKEDHVVATELQVLALRALQPLVVYSSERLLNDAGPAPTQQPLLLQAVAAAGEVAGTRPARSVRLIAALRSLLLRGLLRATALHGLADELPSPMHAGAVPSGPADAAPPVRLQTVQPMAELLAATAGTLCTLLQTGAMLLAPPSWEVLSACLLAPAGLEVRMILWGLQATTGR